MRPRQACGVTHAPMRPRIGYPRLCLTVPLAENPAPALNPQRARLCRAPDLPQRRSDSVTPTCGHIPARSRAPCPASHRYGTHDLDAFALWERSGLSYDAAPTVTMRRFERDSLAGVPAHLQPAPDDPGAAATQDGIAAPVPTNLTRCGTMTYGVLPRAKPPKTLRNSPLSAESHRKRRYPKRRNGLRARSTAPPKAIDRPIAA